MDLYTIRRELMSGKTIYDLPLRVTYYSRVSTEKDEQKNSLDNQEIYYKNKILDTPMWTLVDGYSDRGITGTSTKKRKDFNEMISDGLNDMYDLILTKEVCRFARNTLDTLQLTRSLLAKGKGVYFELDNINTLEQEGELRLTIMASLAQDESRRISERVKFGFKRSIEKYKDNIYILERPNHDHKAKFEEFTYERFGNDAINLGTGLMKYLNLSNERIIIIGENTYYWYVSYFSILCGVGIAVPVDKELPNNEIENVIKRSHAAAVIYSKKKKDAIDKIKDNLPMVKYFIEMNSNDGVQGRDVGIEHVIAEGKKLTDAGNTEYMDVEIDPEEFKFLIFTSGTTSQAKGVMLCHRNLAENVNAVSKYVKIYERDIFFSVLPLHHTYESSIGALLPFANGSSVAICGGLRYIVPDMQEAKPTAMLAVPLLVESLYKKINQSIEKSGKAGLVNSMLHLTNALKSVGIDIKRKVFKEIYDNLGGNMK